MSMVELIMAMTLLAVGMAGVMILITSAIASNNRNKLDTTATVLSQMMLERLVAAGPNAISTFTVQDCQGNSLTVDPTGTVAGRGAALSTDTSTLGNIDFAPSPTPVSGYSINYAGCSAAGSTATYNVRWRITVIQGTDAKPQVKQIIVSARQIGASGTSADQLKFFAPPVTLRSVVSN